MKRNIKSQLAAVIIPLISIGLTATVFAAPDPIASAGGPYTVLPDGSLALNGSASQPSDGHTITAWDWDLNNDNTFGDVTGEMPAAITYADLQSAWNMSPGPNTIQIRVTDSDSKVSSASTTVTLLSGPTFTSSATVVSTDTWNQGANWDTGTRPSGTQSATIASNLTATVNTATVTPTYSGGLTLQSGSSLDARNVANALNAIGTGPVTMNAGSTLRLRTGAAVTLANHFDLAGNALIINSDNSTDNRTRTLNGNISGTGLFTYSMRRGNVLQLNGTNTWSGGFVANNSDLLLTNFSRVQPANSGFGTGNVTLNDGITLEILSGRGNTIHDESILFLNGRGRDGKKLILGSNETVGQLWLDGYAFPAGTYGMPGSGATRTYDWIDGSGILTVADAPADSTAPVAAFAAVGAGGSTTTVFETEPVTYTVTFSEPVVPAPSVADFENTTSTGITVQSVTDISPTALAKGIVYRVMVTATEPGTLNLQIKSGAVIEDLFSNALVVPAADNDTLTVNATPLVGQLGIWKAWFNGGINPGTNEPWKAADRYHLIYVTTGTTNATSTNIADYNAFVTADAASQTGTYANMGTVSWFAFGSTPTIDVKNNVAITGPVINISNNATWAINAADMWNFGNYPGSTLSQLDGTGKNIWTGSTNGGVGHGSNRLGHANPRRHWSHWAGASWVGGVAFSSNVTLHEMAAISEPLFVIDSSDVVAPNLVSIVDNVSGGPITFPDDSVVYTITFNEPMLPSTVTATDFGNAGSAGFTINSVVQQEDPAVFLVTVTPTNPGTLQLRISQDAVLTDLNSNPLDTSSAILDDTIIDVIGGTPFQAWADGFAGLTDSNPSLDFDGGGLATGIEWVLGGNPTNPADDASIAPTIDNTSDPDFFLFTYRRTDAAAADANTTIKAEYGSDLVGWTEALAGPNVEISVDDSGAIDLVTVKIRRTLAVGGKLFVRLNVVVAIP